MKPIDQRIHSMIVDAVDVWSPCGCESYDWDLKKDIEYDVIEAVADELRSGHITMRWVANDLGMSLEQVESVITRYLDEAISIRMKAVAA